MKILVVVAHPDDEILGMGGTILKHVKNNDEVEVIILGQGVTSRYDNSEKNKDEINSLRRESKDALKVLGVEKVHFYDFPDNRFDSVDLLDIIKTLEKHISEFKPNYVYTHFYGDLNIDHLITYKATITACRPINKINVISFEVLSSTEQNAQLESTVFIPNLYIDIEKELEKKKEAMSKYKSELKDYPHPRSLEGIEHLAKYRGLAIQSKAVEAFHIVREIR